MTFLESPRFGESPAGCGSANRDCKQKFRLLRRYRIGCAGVLAGLLLSASGESLAQDPLPEIFLFTTVNGDPVSRFAENSGSTQLTVNVSRTTGGPEVVISFSMVGTGDNPATAGVDFVVEDFEVTIPAGNTLAQRSFNLAVTQDMLVERDETLRLMVSASGYTFNSSTTFRITDDDSAAVTFVSSEVTVSEGDGMATVTVVLTGEVEGGLAVRARTRLVFDGATNTRADNRSDYTETDTDLMFDASTTQVEYSVPILEDNLDEELERFEVLLELAASEPQTGRTITFPDNAVVTITDNDTAPTGITLMLTPASVFEGSSGSTTTSVVTVTAMLSGGTVGAALETATRLTISVESGGSNPATEGTDFTAVGDFRLTIPSGESAVSETFNLVLTGDTVVEDDETLTVSGRGSDLPITETTLTITDDDTDVVLSLIPTSVAEGATMPVAVAVTATLSGFLPADNTTIMVSVEPDTAMEGTDFTEVTSFPITILGDASTGTASFNLTVTDDVIVEPDETVTVSGTTTAAGFGTIAPLTLTITDDDTAPDTITLSLDPPSLREPRGTRMETTAITVTASFPEDGSTLLADTVVMVSVVGGAANPAATEGEDFAAVTDFSVTIVAGSFSGSETFDLVQTGDRFVEGDEMLTVSGSAGSLVVTPVMLTITDRGNSPPTEITLSLSPVSVSEGDAGTTTTEVTVTAETPRSGSTLLTDIEVMISVAGGGDNPATDGGTDFATVDNFLVIIPARSVSGSAVFDLVVTGDTLAEGNETLTVSATAAATFDAIDPQTLTITDESTDTDTSTPTIALSLDPLSALEGATTTVMVTATLSGDQPVSATMVMVMVAGGTATVGTDFTAVTPFSITIPGAGGASFATGSFNLEVADDLVADPEETVTVSGTADARFGTIPPVTLTITNSAPAPTEITLSLSTDRVAEDGTTPVVVTAGYPGGATTAGPTTVTVSVAAGTATAVADFISTPIMITIPGGQNSMSGTLSLTLVEDMLVDGDETVTVSGTTTAAGFGTISSVTLTITDSDTAPTEILLSLNPASAAEGGTGTTLVTITAAFPLGSATLTAATVVTVTLGTRVVEITIPPDEISGTVIVPVDVIDDMKAEGSKIVPVSGRAPGFTVSDAMLTITDDDTAPTAIALSLSPSTPVAEGDSAMVTVTAAFAGTVSLPGDTVVTVAVGDTGDSATEGTDYTTIADFTVTIAAGATSGEGTFQFAPMDDAVVDPDETVTVSGTTTATGFGTISSVTLTITDTDTAPMAITLSTVPTSVPEGATTSVAVTATLAGGGTLASATEVTISVAAGTATAGTDFTAVPAFTVTIDANMPSGENTFQFAVLDDMVADSGETVMVSGTATDFNITPATLTITDTDTASTEITLSTIPTSVPEGATTSVAVTATLAGTVSRGLATEVTVSVAADTASTADFTAVPAFTVTIPANMLTGTANFNLTATEDTIADPDETLTVSGTLASFAITSATLTIDDNDTAPTEIGLGLSQPAANEGANRLITVTATLSGTVTLTESTTVLVVVGETGDSATEGTDYTTVADFTVTIMAGQRSGTGTFQLVAAVDMVFDPNETVTVSGTANDFTVTDAPPLRITNTDTAPSEIALSLSPSTPVAEGDSATVTVTAAFPGSVSLTEATIVTVAVGAGTDSATEGTDYTTVSDFTVTIAVGATSGEGTFQFAPMDDVVVDPDETVTVSGTAAAGFGTISSVTLTITDTDTAPMAITLSTVPTSVPEGATTSVAVTATHAGGGTLASATEVTISVAAGTATAGTDFTAVPAFTVTIDANMPSGENTFQFAVLDDMVADSGETVMVSGTATDFNITPATLTITDTDTASTEITLSTIPTSVPEGATTSVAVTATLAGTVSRGLATEVTVSVAGVTATVGTDFTAVPAFTVTIPANMLTGTANFNLTATEDTIADPDETLTVSGTLASFAITSATLTIDDNDTAPTEIGLGLSQPAANEGANRLITVTATLSGTVTLTESTTVSVVVGKTGDSATEGTDYTTVADFTITIMAGQRSGTGTFQLVAAVDMVFDPNETVTVSGTANDFTVTDAPPLRITNTDTAPSEIALSLSPSTPVAEGDSATVTVTAAFPGSVSLTEATIVTVAVGAGTDSATEGTDYTTVSDFTVTIAVGATSGEGTFQFAPMDDVVVDPDETVTVSGTAAAGFGTISSVTLTITDTDTAPMAITLSTVPTSVPEGATTSVAVTATHAGGGTLASATEVTISVAAGTATAGTDFTAVPAFTVTIDANMPSGENTFQFAVLDDMVADSGETVMVSGTATDFNITPATLTITDTDTASTEITLSTIPTSVPEGATTSVAVTATLAGTVSRGLATEVTVSVAADTASTADFTAVPAFTVTIPANMLTGTANFNLTATEDTIADPDETLTVSGTLASFAITSATLTIDDNDTAPTEIGLRLSQPAANEGANRQITVTARITSTVSLPEDTVVTVAVGSTGDSATEGTDYTEVADFTVTILAGQRSGTGTFQLMAAVDMLFDPNETVTVSGTASGFTVTDATPLRIDDQNTAPTAIALSLSPSTPVDEGASAMVTVTAAFPGSVSLTEATIVTVAVGAGTDSATEGTDYTTVPDFTVTIAAGATSGEGTFQFAPMDDAVVDPDETVTVSGTAAASFGTISSVTLTITDTDIAPTAITLSTVPTSVPEGATTSVAVTATLSGSVSLTSATDVAVSVAAGTATVGTDFTAVTDFTVTIPANMLTGTANFSLVVTEDTFADPDETLTVSGTATGFTTINPATLTITDTDSASSAITLSTVPTNVPEGITTSVAVTATLAGTVSRGMATEVTVSVAADTASTADFTAVPAFTVTIPANMLTGTANFNLTATEDTIADPNETLTVSGTLASFTITSATLTITDNDTAPTEIELSLSQPAANEGANRQITVTARITSTVSLPEDTVVTVAVGSTGDSATEGTDYTEVADFTVTILAGQRSGTGTFQLVAAVDMLFDPNETVTVSGTASGFTVTDATPLMITNTDTVPSTIALSLSPSTPVDEGDSATVTVTAAFPGSVSLTVLTTVSVVVGSAGDSATEGTDYTTVPGFTVTIAAGATSGEGTFQFAPMDDTVVDPDETVTVSGTAATGFGTIPSVTLTITDTDIAPTAITLSTVPTSVPEGATTSVAVTATLSGSVSLTSATDVAVTVAGVTATVGTDFTAVPAFTVTIPANMLTGTANFNLTATEDTVAGPDETLTVSGTATGFTTINPATLTITDNDTAPTTIVLSLSEDNVAEEAGMRLITVTATLSPTSVTLTAVTTVAVTVVGVTATTGTDFTVGNNFTITIAAGATSGTANTGFTPATDTVAEGPETLTFSGTAGGFTITPATLTITDDDTAPTAIALSLSPSTPVNEGASPTVTVTAAFAGTVSLPGDTVVTVTVGDTGDSATEGTDYTTIPDFTVTITAGATSGEGTFQLAATDDTVEDPNETLTVSGTASGFTFTSATLAITNIDTASTAITLSTVPTSVLEGATTTVTVTATLAGTVSRTSATDVVVSVAAGTASTADFTAVTAFTVTIPANMLSGTANFSLVTTEDMFADPDETLTVSGMAAASFDAIPSVMLTITDNDTASSMIALSLSPASVTEGTTTTVTVTATLAGTVSRTSATDVAVSVAAGTASTADFSAVTAFMVTIPANMLSGTANFSLVVTEDTIADPDETVTVSGTVGTFTITPATVTITDNDTAPSAIVLSLNPSTPVAEGASATVRVTATLSPAGVTLPDATAVTVAVGAGTDSATEGTDYGTVTDITVTIAAGATSGEGTFQLAATDDTVEDPNETLTVSGTASGFTFTSATLAITDTDIAPTAITLSTVPTSVPEGATTSVAVTATLSGSVSLTSATDVAVSVAGVTATVGTDFTMVTDFTVTIPANMLTGTANFSLPVTEDTIAEPDETVTVSGTAGTFTITPATVTITDNDTASTAITLSTVPTSVTEGATTSIAVTATLAGTVSRASATEVTVSVAAGTASTADFTAVTAFPVTIPANMLTGTANFSLVVTEDTVADPNETLTVSGSAGGFTITAATLAITDNDTAPTAITLSAVPTSVPEGATTSVAVTATLSGSVSLTSATEVTVSVAAGTATAGTDFTAVTAFMVTIPANMLAGTASFNLPVMEDTIVDPNETLTVSATAAGFGTIPSVTLTITDNDTAPTTIALSLSPTSAAEGITTTVTVTAAYPGNVTLTTATEVTVSVAAGTAQAADFTAVSDFMVTIAAGMNSGTATFDLVATDDTVFTSNKTVTVSGTATSYTVTSATLAIDDDDTPPAAVTLAAATVGESAGAVTVTATLDNEVVGGLTITVATTNTSDTATAGEDYTTPTAILTFAGTAGEIETFPVAIIDDNLVEGDETFTVSLTAPDTFPGTIDITSSTATVTISDDEVNPTTVILTLAPDRVQEDSGTTTIAVSVAYPGGVTLTTATEVTVSVAGGEADEADFTAVSDFTLTIAVGESSSAGSFDLTVTEDEESEGNETLTVSATPTATGFTVTSAPLTILEVDSTAVVMEVVPELARLSVTSVIDAVADRVGRAVAGTANTLVSFAGHQSLAPALAANEQKLNDGDLSWREILKNSSFDLNLESTDEEAGSGGGQADPGGAIGIWASGGYENVSSRDAESGAWEGDLFSVHAGVDMRVSENVLVGVAANRSEGSFEFDEEESLKTDSQLTAISPYLGWNSGDGAGLWATIAYGKGHVEVASDNGAKRDITMAMAAVGGSMDVSVDDEVSLTVKGEAATAQLETKAVGDLEAVTANIQRLRLALEVQDVTVQEAGKQFTRSAALGIRHDGGDGDTGLGAELDGELGWSVPARGVTLRANGHVLLAHQSDLKEWGVGGLIRYDIPGSSEGRGLSLRLQPSYGAESDRGQLWEHQVTELESESDDAPGARLAMGLDWGRAALSGRGLLTPYGNLELSEDGARVYRLGSRLEIGPAIHIDLGGDRKEAADEAPEHGIDLAVRVSW